MEKSVDILFFTFATGSDFGSMTRIISGIEMFCFQHSSLISIALTARLKRKKYSTFCFSFILLAGRKLGSIARAIGRIKQKLLFSAFVIVFYRAHSQTETKKGLSSRNRGMVHPFFINMLTALKGSQFSFYLNKMFHFY